MKYICENCIHLRKRPWNMIHAFFYSCGQGLSFARDMFKDTDCPKFEPHIKAINMDFLKELHRNETDGYDERRMSVWRIVNNGKKYKRISGDASWFLCFKSEEQLDRFYNQYKDIINNAIIKCRPEKLIKIH